MKKILHRGLFLSLLFAFVFSLASPVPAQGQTSDAQTDDQEEILSGTEGLFLEAHLQGHGVTVEDDDTDNGRGFGVKVGYGFTPLITAYLGIDGASMDVGDPGTRSLAANEYSLVYVDLGGRLNFRSGQNSVVPYLDASLSGIASTYSTSGGDVTFSGSGASVGAGLQYFVSRQFALNGGLDLTFGSYDEVEAGSQTESVDLGFTGARIDVAVSWYPFQSD